MKISGKYYQGKTASGVDTVLELGDDGFLYSEELAEPVSLKRVVISSRIGNIPRRLQLPSGAIIETRENDRLDTWLHGHGKSRGLLHRLESNLKTALFAVFAVAVIFTWFAIWGVPWLSTRAAAAIPVEVNNYIGAGTLEALDARLFKQSNLEPARQAELTERFNALIPVDEDVINYRLLFRGGGLIGPNAFALPDGTVVITDELVHLAKDDDEIMSVLLHEIGHVVHRHSLRMVISHSGLIAMTTIITGDVNTAGSLVLAMPNVLADSSYSREFEYEADSYSLKHLPAIGIAPVKFADFMERLVNCAQSMGSMSDEDPETPTTAQDCEKITSDQQSSSVKQDGWIDYISSHPPTINRISRFRQTGQSVTIDN